MNLQVYTTFNSLPLLIFKAMVCLAFAILTTEFAFSQDCDPNVPHFIADLSDDPAGVFLTPFIQRDGNCCGTTHPDKCVSFSITLHEDAVGILFDVCEGAMPPGALFYQVGCGPPVSVGNVLCLDGPGPHHLTFCKPGNNQNVYCITSIPPPGVGPNQLASDGCTADIWAIGYNPESIQWTSVYPGPQGAFNDLLNCTNCETATVTAPDDFPPYVDFMACGTTIGSCATTPYCDTVRVYFASTLAVEIAPEEPAICFGSTGTEVTAVGSGGYPPYIFTWSNGEIGENVWIEEPGDYTVTVTDTSGCPPASFTFTVIEYAEPLTADAGGQIVVCDETDDIQLNGTFTGMDQAEWLGGNGTFWPNEFTANATYVPTPEEIEHGHVELVLALIPLGSCPPAYDTLNIFFAPFEADVLVQFEHIQCHGANDGLAEIFVTGDWEPYTIDWNHADTGDWELTGLAPGTYSAMVNNSLGCGQEIEFTLTEPELLEAHLEIVSNVSCHGEADGSIVLQVSGGTEPYSFFWSNGQSSAESETLSAGAYGVFIFDDNFCPAVVQFEITEPTPLEIEAFADTLVCVGSDLTLTAEANGGSGEFTYFWNPAAEQTDTIQVVAEENTVYSVYAEDANNCLTDTVMLPVSVISMDEDLLETTAGNPVCTGSTTTVEAFYDGDHPPYSYQWSHGLPGTPGPHSVQPTETTTYTVTVSDDCGNEVTGTATVTILPLPDVQLVNTTDITCFGMNDGSTTVAVDGGTVPYSFVWSDGLDHGANANGLPPGNYSVQVTDANGCGNEVEFDITEPQDVSITASADTLICLGSETVLAAEAIGGTGNFTYHWNHSGSDLGTVTETPDEDTEYTVFATDENGCQTETLALNVSVISMDEDLLQTFAGDPVCLGWSTSVEAIYNGVHPPYTYQWSHELPDGQGPHTVSPNESTVYTVTVSDICNNTVSGEVAVTIWPLPELQLVETTDVSCNGLNDGSATVSAAGGTPTYAYHWAGTDIIGPSVNNLHPGSHSVIVSDANQCPDSLAFSISEPDPLTLSATSDTLVCPDEIFTLEALASGGLGDYTYHWSHQLPNSETQEVSVTENTTFEVFVTDANNCPTPAEILPVQVITMHPGLLSVWNSGNVCPEETSDLSAIYQGDYPPYTYTWSTPAANGPGPHTVQPDETTTYSLEVSDECGNSLDGNTTVIVHPLPEVNLPSMLAEGCSDLFVTYEDTQNSPGNHTFTWSVNQSQFYPGHVFEHTFTTPGLHEIELTVTSHQGCQASSDQPSFVLVRPGVTADFIATPWEAGIDHPEVKFTDISFENIQEWNWNFGDGAESDQQHPEHMYPDTGSYMVQLVVSNQFDCTDSISRIVRIKPVYDIIIPNAFTPTSNGGNGYYDPTATNNDIFYPFADYVEEFRMSIFNRWGELIFESLDFNYGWNGTYRGEPCPQDVYVYKVEFVFSDGVNITRVGDVTLFR